VVLTVFSRPRGTAPSTAAVTLRVMNLASLAPPSPSVRRTDTVRLAKGLLEVFW
jgi:hypothetical protein